MTRIELVDRRHANPVVKAAYHLTRRELGRMVDPVAVYAHAPQLLLGYAAFEKATARADRVDARLKALAALKAGTIVNCEFCIDIGSKLAQDAGITEEQLRALPRYHESPKFTHQEKLVLDYATAMSRTPTEVTAELFRALSAQFDAGQLVELTNEIAIENMRARFNSAFDMTAAGFSEGMVCAVPEPPAA